jgi:hypothetical protein
MDDWPKVLQNFKKTITKVQSSSQSSEDRTSPLRLLRLIVRNNSRNKLSHMEANFLYAALHLACMKDLRFPEDTCPDLPENVEALART